MNRYKKIYLSFTLLALGIAVLFGFQTKNTAPTTPNECQLLNNSKMPATSTQIIVVDAQGGIKAQLNACQLHQAQWQPLFNKSIPVVIGKHGLAAAGEKKEGDLKTPTGLYPIEWAFGTQHLALKMDYRYITAEDKFVDDVQSKQYNSWVHGNTSAQSFETMQIAPYKMGAVVNYNMNPVVAGAGSAIFIHLWDSPEQGTAGCIAMSEVNLSRLLHWLDKKQHPYILIN